MKECNPLPPPVKRSQSSTRKGPWGVVEKIEEVSLYNFGKGETVRVTNITEKIDIKRIALISVGILFLALFAGNWIKERFIHYSPKGTNTPPPSPPPVVTEQPPPSYQPLFGTSQPSSSQINPPSSPQQVTNPFTGVSYLRDPNGCVEIPKGGTPYGAVTVLGNPSNPNDVPPPYTIIFPNRKIIIVVNNPKELPWKVPPGTLVCPQTVTSPRR